MDQELGDFKEVHRGGASQELSALNRKRAYLVLDDDNVDDDITDLWPKVTLKTFVFLFSLFVCFVLITNPDAKFEIQEYFIRP